MPDLIPAMVCQRLATPRADYEDAEVRTSVCEILKGGEES